MADEEVDVKFNPRAEAVKAATSGRPELAQAWAMISIAEDVARIRQDVHWQTRRPTRG